MPLAPVPLSGLKDGKVISIDNDSGHFKPDVSTLSKSAAAFKKLGAGAYDSKAVKFYDINGKPATVRDN